MNTSIGIDLGGTKLRAVLVRDGRVVEERRVPNETYDAGLSEQAIAAVRLLWDGDVDAIGVGLAGLVRWPDGIFVWGPHVAGTDIPVRATLEREFGVPVVVDNDANLALLGELRLGRAGGKSSVLLVTLGTGIGGAVAIDGRIYRGTSFAGEVGHVITVPDGPICDCGKRGCWETVASGPALARMALEVIARNPRGEFAVRFRESDSLAESITRAAEAGDEIARTLVTEVGVAFGRGLANLIAILDPELIVVGGGLGAVGESLTGPARRVVASRLHGRTHRKPPVIESAALGELAGAVGAALLAVET